MAIVLIGLAGLFIVSLRRYIKVEELRLPNLVGMNIKDAKQLLEKEKVAVVTFRESKDGFAINTISSQTPKPGEIIRRGRSVSLGVNLAETEIRIPVLVGAELDVAKKLLANYNLKLGEESYDYSDKPFGQIIGQTPISGSMGNSDTAVNVVISRGPQNSWSTLPQVIGLSKKEAVRRLSASGFKNINTQIAGVSQRQSLDVVDQVPEAGTLLSPSSRITLSIAIPSNKVVDVPNLIGIPLIQAQSYLSSRGLVLGNTVFATDPNKAPGIISYTPSGYTLRGSPVEIVVNRAGLQEPITNLSRPPHSATTYPNNGATTSSGSIILGPNPNYGSNTTTFQTPTGGGNSIQGGNGNIFNKRMIHFNFNPQQIGLKNLLKQAFTLRLDIDDDLGSRTVFEKNLAPGQVVSQMIELNGDATLTTYINDSLFQSWKP